MFVRWKTSTLTYSWSSTSKPESLAIWLFGEAPNSQIAKDSGLEVDDHEYVKVDVFQRTNIPGVFAAGDVTNQPVKQIGTAVGQGITAALEAYGYIRRPY